MTLFKNVALISAIIGIGGYLLQTLMIIGCCDKYINFQVNLFRVTVVAMLVALISYCVTFFIK